MNRTTVSSFYGLYFVTSGIRNLIEANKLHDAYTGITGTSTSASYPIYHTGVDATVGDENRVINNLIYNINNNGSIYALYNSSSDGVFYYHNTVSLDDQNATGGLARGFYQLTTATGIEFKNNIITVTRTGTGTKHCIYFGTAASTIASDYNVFYINAPAGTNNLGYSGGDQATLLAWQTATSGDANSVDADPIYANILANNLTPANAAIDGIATATVGVANDFFGISRAVTPDPGAIEFTPPSCAQPSALTTINITATSADLGWTENGTATVWDIEIDTAGFTPTGVPTITGTTTNPHNINTLLAQTSYDFYVRADCGGPTSAWSGPYTFTTACGSVIAPWSEAFENAGVIPTCWNQGLSNSENWLFANTASGKHVGNNGVAGGATTSGNYFAWVDDSTPDNTGTTLESPFIDVSGLTVPELSFFLISNNETHSNVNFSVDVWDGAAWNVGFYTHNTNTVNGEWEKILVSLSSLTITGGIKLRFIVDEPSNGDFYDDVAIDDVDIHEAPACPAPTSLLATNILASSADLGWTENGSATMWDIELGAAGFIPTGIPTITGTTTNPHNVTTLTATTSYDFYVRADCGVDSSLWVGPFSFTTACASQLSGTYTIGALGNYPNFNAAVAALSCGISTPVIFNVLPGSGPYNEQITITPVTGASSTNTITFNGNGETITYASTGTGDNFIIRLDGADYITFDSLNIITQSTTNNFAVHLTNDADFNTVNNCNIDLTSAIASTLSSNVGIVVSGSLTSATATGASGTNNTFTNNTITGGYYGIAINGASSSIESLNNIISGNTIQDFYFYGAYLRSITGSVISNNDIHRMNRTSVSSFYGLYFVTSGSRNLIEANKLHDAYTGILTASTSASYPIYHTGVDAAVGDENRVVNNLIYNINNNGSIYALYNSSSDGVYYYHNTVSLDDQNATGGLARGFYQITTASNIEFKNNIITNTRSGGGALYCIYLATATSTVVSDYNVFYTPTSINNIGYFGGNQNTLINWQGATLGDANSVDADPIYANILSNDLTPANAAIDGIATATVGVTNDFYGIARAVTPDPGAIEFTPPSCAQPSALTTINITATSADLGWTENGTATVWDIEIDTAGFTSTGVPTIIGTTTNPHNVNTLLAQTSYDFYVRADCGGPTSAWSGPYTFTTACAAVIAPWTENFENAGTIPACWNQGASNSESWLFANTGSGNHIGNNGTLGGATTSGNYFAWVDDSSPHNTATTLESPFIDVTSLTNPTLKFFLISNNEGFTNVDFSVDVWDGAAWNVGYYAHNTNTVNGEWEQITVNLSTLAITGDVQLRFIVDENNGTDFYDDVAIDDVQIIEATVCTAQLNLGSDTIICTPGSILLDAGTNYSDYLWSDAGASTTSSILVDSTSFGIGVHTIHVVAIDTINNCVTRDTIVVEISTCVGIGAVANSVNMNVYPNPNNGEFTLNINTTDINELAVKVLNTQGQVVYTKNNYSNVTNINDKIDLSNNANGIYFIVITTDKGIVTHKLVIH